MSRRRNRRQPNPDINSGDLDVLSREEICTVLRGAEDAIASHGRSTVVKILRGSKAKTIPDEMRKNPSYGKLADLPEAKVLEAVDWCIEHNYLRIEFFDGFPLLTYTFYGLMIECRIIAREYLEKIRQNPDEFLATANDRPLQTLFAILDLIADLDENERVGYHEFLEKWAVTGTKRMKARANAVLAEWSGTGPKRRHVFETTWIDPESTISLYSLEERDKRNNVYLGRPLLAEPEIARSDFLTKFDQDSENCPESASCILTDDTNFYDQLKQSSRNAVLFRTDGTLDNF